MGATSNPTKAHANGADELEGLSATEQYKALRWGRDAKRLLSVNSTSPKAQALVELGKLQALYLVDVNGEDVGTLVRTGPFQRSPLGP